METVNAAQLWLDETVSGRRKRSDELLVHLALRGRTVLVWERFELVYGIQRMNQQRRRV